LSLTRDQPSEQMTSFPIPHVWFTSKPGLAPTDLTHPRFIPPPRELERTELPFDRSSQKKFRKTLHGQLNKEPTCSVKDDVRSIAEQLYYLNPPFSSTRKYSKYIPRHSNLTTKTQDKIQWKTTSDRDSVAFLARAFLKCTNMFSSVLPVELDRPGRKMIAVLPRPYYALTLTLADGSAILLPLAFDCLGSERQPNILRYHQLDSSETQPWGPRKYDLQTKFGPYPILRLLHVRNTGR
jgi:hypothetical protein